MKLGEKIKAYWHSKRLGVENFEQAATIASNILENLALVIEGICEHNPAKITRMTTEALGCERQLRQIFQKVVRRMYSRETMNFSREDRQYIMNQMLEITDPAIFLIRRFSVYHPQFPPQLRAYLQERVPSIQRGGELLHQLVHALFNNFTDADAIMWEIHEMQREFWPGEVNFLKEIYQTDLNQNHLLLFEILLRDLRRIQLMIVRFSDTARQFILKATI